MSIIILEVTEHINTYYFRCHIDNNMVDAQGQPLRDYVMVFNWGKEPPKTKIKVERFIGDTEGKMQELSLKHLNGLDPEVINTQQDINNIPIWTQEDWFNQIKAEMELLCEERLAQLINTPLDMGDML